MNKVDEFKLYILKRRDAFENKYGIGNKTKGDLYNMDLPNNLKYLDDMSQMFIRTLNTVKVPVRDKILTVFVYRLIGDEKYIRRLTSINDVVTIHELEKIAKKLNSSKFKLAPNYRSSVIHLPASGLSMGENFLASCADFIDNLPEDLFYKWKCSDIFKYYNLQCNVYGINSFTAYNLATDISYINELHIEIDLIKGFTETMRKMYLILTGEERFSASSYYKFAQEIMEWYADQAFADNKERIITINDVGHMLLSYYKYSIGKCKIRYPKKTQPKTNNIVISRSMYEFYKGLSSKTD